MCIQKMSASKFVIFLGFIFMHINTDAQQKIPRRIGPATKPPKATTAATDFNADSAYEKQMWISPKGDTLRYRLLLPENYNPATTYPFILFLHGAGERGNDNTKQLVHGANLFLQPQIRKDYPAIILFPQCPENDFWANVVFQINDSTKKYDFIFQEAGAPTPSMQLLLDWLPEVEKKYNIEKYQRYVMGLSMGGMGTFEILRRKPRYFAAAVPICGGANPKTAEIIRETALWIFHGANDDVVPLRYSEQMVEALQKFYARAEVNFTIYNNVGHNSWDKTFAEPELIPWLFKQRLSK